VGRSEFSVLVEGEPEFDFQLEVFPTKLDYEADYQQLIAEVQDVLTGLVVEYLRATFQLGLPARTPQPTHVEWLTLLRHVMDDLERALRHVAERPRWGLARQTAPVRIERLKRADNVVRRAIIRGKGSGRLMRLPADVTVRERISERKAQLTLDTPEHRWLATQLARIRHRLASLREDEERRVARYELPSHPGDPTRLSRIVEEIDGLERRVARLERLEPYASVAGPPPAGFASLQLFSAPGYQEAYRACLILAMGLRLAGDPVRLSLKDLHRLYEYWCFLAVLQLVGDATGQPVPARDLLAADQHGLHVRIRKGRTSQVVFRDPSQRKLTVSYNPRFDDEAFITAQQPDLMLAIEDPQWPTIRMVLDAKYRLDASDRYTQRYRFPGPPDEAVNVLHRYRDAILERDRRVGDHDLKRTVVEGAVLFPLRLTHPGEFQESRLWKALERVGIGAIPFLPGETGYVKEWLRRLLARGGWALADYAIPHRALEWAADWQVAATQPVLVGVLRGGAQAEEHLDWIRRERLYYMPVRKKQRRQYATRWVAIYSPTALREPGAVAHVAAVEEIEVLPRKAIHTPWAARRATEELQVVYRLGPLEELDTPVENRGPGARGVRFSDSRWTSRLALRRATELRELFLETEPEWRLFEDLRAAGIRFELEPGHVTLQDPEDPRGRAWFVTDLGRIQYRGAAGFLWRRGGAEDLWFARPLDVVQALRRVSAGSEA
jgi:hypothetical protein